MADVESPLDFYLGAECDPTTLESTGKPILYPSRHLTTHGVVVGMTGSGKTGLCLAILEEAALDGIPAILIDPKGDMTNLLLAFPGLTGAEFEPWVREEDAQRKGMSRSAFAEEVAGNWKAGLDATLQSAERVARLRESADILVFTPGTEIGIPISIVRNFNAPDAGARPEEVQEKASSTVSALLGLAGITGDAVRSREHILLTNILLHVWNEGRDLALAELIAMVQKPPIRKLGVFDIDTFFPENDRYTLALAINNILASPSFAGWMKGPALDLARLLTREEGRPKHLIFSIAHLGDQERMFFVTLLLEEILAWTRSQSGSTSLRLLVYFDEVFGYLPPHPAKPPSKEPLLILLKQARAFGVGVLLATQNPVDLDYKALSNAGTWFVGKLQTERDKARLLDGLEGVAAQQGSLVERGNLDRLISSLSTRKFLYHNVHEGLPKVIETRWVMSYLRGPLDRDEVRQLMDPRRAKFADEGAAPAPRTVSVLDADEHEGESIADHSFKQSLKATGQSDLAGQAGVRPVLPPAVPQYYVPATVSSHQAKAAVGASGPAARVYAPRVLGHAKVRFVDRRRSVDTEREYWLLAEAPPEHRAVGWSAAQVCVPLDLASEPDDEPACWLSVPASMNEAKEIKDAGRQLQQFLYDTSFWPIQTHDKFKLASAVDETPSQFLERCRQEAIARRDEEAKKIRTRFETRFNQIEERIRKTQQAIDSREAEYAARRRTEFFAVGETVLRFFLGRRRHRDLSYTSRGMRMTERSRQSAAQAKQDIRDFSQKQRELQQELEAAMEDLNDKWLNQADQIQEFRVSPRKTDIVVMHLGLAWIPMWEVVRATGERTLVPAVDLEHWA